MSNMSAEMKHFLNFCAKKGFNFVCMGLPSEADLFAWILQKEYSSYNVVENFEKEFHNIKNKQKNIITTIYAQNIQEALLRILTNEVNSSGIHGSIVDLEIKTYKKVLENYFIFLKIMLYNGELMINKIEIFRGIDADTGKIKIHKMFGYDFNNKVWTR